MATVVHHEADRPWIEALSNAISTGSQSIATQRMERDKLAVQISENAKQRALDSYLTGMRIKGRYVNAKMTNETAKSQHAIVNANNAKTLELNINRDERERDKVLLASQRDVADAELVGLVNDTYNDIVFELDKTGKFIAVDKSDPKWRKQAGLPPHPGLAEKTTINDRLKTAMDNPYLRPRAAELGLAFKEARKEKLAKLNANVPIINSMLAREDTTQIVRQWAGENPATEQLYTKEEILADTDGRLKFLASINETQITAQLRANGISMGTEEVAKIANAMGVTETAVSEMSVPFSSMVGTMHSAGGLPNGLPIFARDGHGDIKGSVGRHHNTVVTAYQKADDIINETRKIGANVSLMRPLTETYQTAMTTTTNAILPHFKTIMHRRGIVFSNFEKVSYNLQKQIGLLIQKDQNILSRKQLVGIEDRDPLAAKILQLARGGIPHREGTLDKVDYSISQETLTPDKLVSLAREIAYGFLASKDYKIDVMDVSDPKKGRNVRAEAKSWQQEEPDRGREAPPPPDVTTIKLTSTDEARILTDPQNADGSRMTAGNFIKSAPFTTTQQESLTSITSDAEVKKVSDIINRGTNTDQRWLDQSPSAVINRVFGKHGKDYLKDLRQAEVRGDRKAIDKLNAWYSLRRKTIMNDMTQSNKFPWQNKPTGWNFIDFLDWKINMDGHAVITRKWLNDALGVGTQPHSGTPTHQQLEFILDSYNVQLGDAKLEETDSTKRGFSYDVQDLLNEIKQSRTYKNMMTMENSPGGGNPFLDSAAFGAGQRDTGSQQDAGIKPFGAGSQYKYPGIHTNLP